MSTIPHDVPLDVILEDHATFHKVLKETKTTSSDASTESSSYESSGSSSDDESSITTLSTQLDDEVPVEIKVAEMQRKIEYYKSQVVEADRKIGSLTLQLERATSSESALVIAVNDIETQRLALEERFMEKRKKWKNLPHKEQELRAETEKEFMNELVAVTNRMEAMNRSHNHAMRQKDKQVKQLQQKLKQWEKVSGGGNGDQVFYSN